MADRKAGYLQGSQLDTGKSEEKPVEIVKGALWCRSSKNIGWVLWRWY
jgi:hypothetical protein